MDPNAVEAVRKPKISTRKPPDVGPVNAPRLKLAVHRPKTFYVKMH